MWRTEMPRVSEAQARAIVEMALRCLRHPRDPATVDRLVQIALGVAPARYPHYERILARALEDALDEEGAGLALWGASAQKEG